MNSVRLILKKIEVSDEKRYVSQVMTEEVMRYITGKGLSEPLAERRFEEALLMSDTHPNFGIFTVWLKETGEYIGLARMKLENNGSVEIGYNLLQAYWGKGYGSEIGSTLMNFLKNMTDRSDVFAIALTDNTASVRIIEKLGLQITDEKREDLARVWRIILRG